MAEGTAGHPEPSLAELARVSRLPRHVETLDFWVDPAVAFGAVVDDSANAFWLDGGADARSGWSHMGDLGRLGTVVRCDAATGKATLWPAAGGAPATVQASVFDLIAVVDRSGPGNVRAGDPGADDTGAGDAGAGGFDLGLVGFIDYESGATELGLPVGAAGAQPSVLLFADRALSFDHERRQMRLTTLVAPNSTEHLDWCERVALQLRLLAGRRAPSPAPPPALPAVRMRHTATDYGRLIAACVEQIAAGNAYQLCLTNRFEVDTPEAPATVYRRLRLTNPTAHGALIVAGDIALLSSSPEVFLSTSPDGRVTTRPIKGTRPRGLQPADDDRLREELRGDPKERAENVMIVDLMRNDLSKVSELGSVEVSGLFDVEEYANVFQLVSTVTARLRPDTTIADLLRSAFPAGSMTGAPKLSAMRLLHDLEGGARGAYAGAFGFISPGGAAQLAMTIRTIVLTSGVASMGSGGGITALSVIEREVDETFIKIAPLLAALGSRIADG